jgi:hypothetical protein
MIHQHATHVLSYEAKGVCRVGGVNIALRQSKECLVQNGRRLQRMSAAFAAHEASRQATQVVVYRRRNPREDALWQRLLLRRGDY